MKKLIMLLLGVFIAFGAIGCNNDGSDLDIDMKEFIENPTNLSINDKVLSWDAVEDASGYIVYANEEEVDKVSAASYDFSSLSGDKIIFQVRTRAPRGMKDSPLSVKIAYVANRDAEITSVSRTFESKGYTVNQAFVVELVNKGMVNAEVEVMLTEYDEFSEMLNPNVYVDYDFEALIDALREMLETAENVEALISAVVKTMLPEMIQDEIDEANAMITMYESYFGGSEYYSDQIEEYQNQIAALRKLLVEIMENPDDIILALTSAIAYFDSVQEMISEDFIDAITNLSETDDIEDLSVAELVLVKEEMVNILRTTMPEEEDMVLLMKVVSLLASISDTSATQAEMIENYDGKLAAQAIYTMEAYVNYLDSFDEAYFTSVVNQLKKDQPESLAGAEIAILSIKYFSEFKEDNQKLLDTITDLFTDEEKEAMFNQYINSLDEMDFEDIDSVKEIFDSINFEDLLKLQVMLEDSLDALLEAFVSQDGEVLRLIAISMEFDMNTLSNDAVNKTYTNETALVHAQDLNQIKISEYALELLNALVQSVDEDASQVAINFIVGLALDTLSEYMDMMYGSIGVGGYGFSKETIDAAKIVFLSGFEAINEDTLNLMKKLFDYLVDEKVMADYYSLTEDVQAYNIRVYGNNYLGGRIDMEIESYAEIIFIAEQYDNFMTAKNRQLLDDIVASIFTTLKDDDVQALTSIDDVTVSLWEAQVQVLLDLFSDDFSEIKAYEWDDLKLSEMENIEDFMDGVQEVFMSFFMRK